MADTRSSSPDNTPPQDLWSSILDSVSSSRSIPSKNVLILGQPTTGKSTLASALLQKPLAEQPNSQNLTNFALGYDWADVRDEGDEDTLARLSVYTVPSSSKSYTSLLPHFLPPRSALSNTIVVIALDWTRPWSFIEELQTWLVWLESWVKSDSSREAQIVREETREKLEAYLQHYTEPTNDDTTTALSSAVLPLSPGTFTHNLSGIPIVVVCTKADLIDEGSDIVAGASGMGSMVKGKGGEWEERTDSVMQVLRTVCLKYGAALFYTTQMPTTLQVLRQYVLHMLFIPPAPQPGMTTAAEPAAANRTSFPFTHKPNPLDRDRIVIPSGWDSWGKISILRDSFDSKAWAEAWEKDLESGEESATEGGARKVYTALVPDHSTKPPPLPAFNSPVPEQTFLSKHYDDNAKNKDRDPRGAFKNPTDVAGASAGIVGPMGSSSFNLPSVERVWQEMEKGMSNGPSVNLAASTSSTDAASRRLGNRMTNTRPAALNSLGNSTNSPPLGRPSSSPPPTGASNPSNQTQHEVLHNFFQSLLVPKPNRTPTKPNGTTASLSSSASSAPPPPPPPADDGSMSS